MESKSNEPPKIRSGDPGYYEDWLVGNREGLYALRDTIDEVLESGEDAFFSDECESEFQGISLTEAEGGEAKSGKTDLFAIGCLILFFATGAFTVFGVIQFIRLVINGL